MAVTKAKPRKKASNIIVGLYPPKKKMTLRDYIKTYGLKVGKVRKIAREIGVEPCLAPR
jgi:hypothetical protein